MRGLYVSLAITLALAAGASAQTGRIWTIAFISADYGRVHYKSALGERVGALVEMAELVCAEAGMECRITTVLAQYCWQANKGSHSTGGRGVFGRWFDACAGYINTPGRSGTFQFGQYIIKDPDAFIFVLKGARTVDPNNLQKEKIGFMFGWSTDEVCLFRTSDSFELNTDKIFHYRTGEILLEAMRNGEVDAAFGMERMWHDMIDQVIKLPAPYPCYVGGHGMMARKDSQFTANFNVGITKLRNSNKFEKFCEEANARHAHAGEYVECLT